MTPRNYRGSSIGWIADAFEETSQEGRYRNRWLTDQKWSELVHSHYFGKSTGNVNAQEIKEAAEKMKFSRPNLIRSIGKKWGSTLDDFTETNQTGIPMTAKNGTIISSPSLLLWLWLGL